MKAIAPNNEELQILEALRAHRRKHRKGFPTKISSRIENDFSGLTIGQKISDAVAKTVGSWKFALIQSTIIFFGLLITR